jgi:hypothetical protein
MFIPGRYSESEVLVGYLDQQLTAIRAAAYGLTDQQARQTPCRSALSIGGLVKHRLMSMPKRHLVDPSLAPALMDCSSERLLGDLNTLGYLFESLATRDVRVYAQANDASVFHYRERGGELEMDVVVERRDGEWAGFEVKLGGDLIDEAAAALLRLAQTRVALPPAALVVLTGTDYAYRRKDGVLVVPLGLLGP